MKNEIIVTSGSGVGPYAYPYTYYTAGMNSNVKIPSEINAQIRLLAIRLGISVPEAREQVLRLGIAAMERRVRGRRPRGK